MDIRLPDFRASVLQQITKSITSVFMLAGNNSRRLDAFTQSAEARIIIRWQALLHPVDAVGSEHLGHLHGVAFCPRHPAVEHDISLRTEQFASTLHKRFVDLHALAAVGGTLGNGDLKAL